ncbi:SPFH domain, Band 7 family protein [Sporobacter termitidis DSM 10068]|uniref:SPFH domain, Band 7 family protein n=1 Tax=Sporobacter termitidis DSM 10068 TaxID=1123282 RepID=A0A1M5WXU1_9FIRM|nr:prohibitin family protein [Sporobacter termitidis]SHH92486.1 SPFH domain, Band 7 family protein [Sporobacter termitidis DSM 10068]
MQETAAPRQKTPKKIFRLIILAVVVVFLVIVALSSFTTINSGTVGVVSVFGAVKNEPLYEGLHVVAPFITSVSKVDTRTQKVEVNSAAASKDLQTISTTIVVNYHVTEATAPQLYASVGRGFENVIVVPAIQESVKAVVAQYSAEELITKRQLVSTSISEKLSEKIDSYGLVIEIFNITNLEFSDAFNTAIEAKQTAQQEALKAEQDLNRIKIEAEQKVVNAQAEANATKAQADAQAYAIDVIQNQLAQSNAYLEYQKIQKWDGQLPMVQGDSSPIIDFRENPSAAANP